jgi:pimeloyl-ACP methyl ester carboxylesterase
MARYLANQGILVVAFDNLGVGESRCDVNGQLLTPEKQGQANHLMVQQIREGLTAGTFLPEVAPLEHLCIFGVGHSMGAMGIVTQQALLKSYEAIALLGYGHNVRYPDAFGETLLREMGREPSPSASPVDLLLQGFQAATHENGYMLFPRKALHLFFHDETVSSFVIEADDRYATVIPSGVAWYAAGPGLETLGQYAALIDVPVFLGNAAREGVENFRAEPTRYPRTHDITLFELEGAAHCHNFTPRRKKLWQRIAGWIWEVTAGRAGA